MFKNIIFDWSGVIKDAGESHCCVVNEIFKRIGLKEISIEEMRDNWEQPYMRFYNIYKYNWTKEEENKVYKEVIKSNVCPALGSYPGIVETIYKLRDMGKSMVVLSTDSPEMLLPEMKEYGLEDVFNEIYLDIYDKADKIHELMKTHDFKPEETVFIGDSNHEIEVGKLVGIKTLAVTWGFSSEKKLKSFNPDFIVHNIKELEEILLK